MSMGSGLEHRVSVEGIMVWVHDMGWNKGKWDCINVG